MPKKDPLWTPRGGYGIKITGVNGDWAKSWYSGRAVDYKKETQVNLFKLHGSINWRLYTNKMPSLKKRPYLVSTRNGRPRSEQAAFLPPGWHKRIDRQPYSSIWRNARLELEKCASLVIIGYSLPDTDLIARALFLEMVRRRSAVGKYLEELHIAEVNDATRQRLIDLFLPALGRIGKLFRYSSAKQLAESWK
jgi:hypothetical protein